MNDARYRLIVALDVPDRTAALAAVDILSGHVGCFKLGLEIFVREGPSIVQAIADRGEKVFLDLKLHDIPNTVAGAVRSASRLNVAMLTLHAAGGIAMLKAARDAARSFSSPPLLLAVTALTSLGEEEIRNMGVANTVASWVEMLAELACSAGIGGVVASARELPVLRAKFSGKLEFVVPGIRPRGVPGQDQVRTSTPADAIRAGAGYLVVGRPILAASDPAAAADSIVREIAETFSREQNH